jgi:hypothetical protein
MSAVKGLRTTKYDAGPQGDNAVDQGFVNAEVEIWTDEYEASALAAGSTIDIAELPAGAKVLKVELITDALGSTSTIDIGDSDDPDRYSASPFDVATAGKHESDTVAGFMYVIGTNDGDSRLQLLSAVNTLTGTIKTAVHFTR